MAEIRFQILQQPNGTPTRNDLQGSGLAFYGSSAGSSVQIGEFQDNTFIANSTGSAFSDQCFNVKYVGGKFPSGQTVLSGQHGATDNIGLSGIKTFQSTIGIEFGHTTAVKAQNCQLRIFDRSNINNPASGVNTKVAEIVNHNGYSGSTAWQNQGSVGVTSAAVGSGDAVWWGEPWPAALCTQKFWTNSSSVKFYNGLDSETRTNGDSRLASAGIAGSFVVGCVPTVSFGLFGSGSLSFFLFTIGATAALPIVFAALPTPLAAALPNPSAALPASLPTPPTAALATPPAIAGMSGSISSILSSSVVNSSYLILYASLV